MSYLARLHSNAVFYIRQATRTEFVLSFSKVNMILSKIVIRQRDLSRHRYYRSDLIYKLQSSQTCINVSVYKVSIIIITGQHLENMSKILTANQL